MKQEQIELESKLLNSIATRIRYARIACKSEPIHEIVELLDSWAYARGNDGNGIMTLEEIDKAEQKAFKRLVDALL